MKVEYCLLLVGILIVFLDIHNNYGFFVVSLFPEPIVIPNKLVVGAVL